MRRYWITDKYCTEPSGIEIGPSSSNDFGLPSSINVGLEIPLYQSVEAEVLAPLHIICEGDCVPLEDSSVPWIFSSHVIEHLPNLTKAINEWIRLIKNGGYIIIICPLRNALKHDAMREITPWSEIWYDYETNQTCESHTHIFSKEDLYGHYHVFDISHLKMYIRKIARDKLKLMDEENPDSRIGNGFTLVYKVIK
jgi:predicted SAM-dependent methyltransferase